jgi:hypothetical protein
MSISGAGRPEGSADHGLDPPHAERAGKQNYARDQLLPQDA